SRAPAFHADPHAHLAVARSVVEDASSSTDEVSVRPGVGRGRRRLAAGSTQVPESRRDRLPEELLDHGREAGEHDREEQQSAEKIGAHLYTRVEEWRRGRLYARRIARRARFA